MNRCVATKMARDDCARGCASRWHCVLGQDYRYPPDEIEYHSLLAHKSLVAWRAASGM